MNQPRPLSPQTERRKLGKNLASSGITSVRRLRQSKGELESNTRWAEFVAAAGSELLPRDAKVAKEQSNAVRAAGYDRWTSPALAVELDIDPNRMGL